METITNRKLNLSGFKPLIETNLLTEKQFSELVKSGNFEVFTSVSLSKYVNSILKENNQDNIQKAQKDLNFLIPKTVLLADGNREVRYLKAKADVIVDNLNALSKGFKEKFEAKMEEWKVSDIGELKEKYSDEEQSKFWEEIDAMHTSKKESGDNEDNPDGNGDTTNLNNDESEKQDDTEKDNSHNDDDEQKTNDLEDDEAEMLMTIQELLEEDNEVDFKELSEEEGFTDDETKKVLLTLKEKDYIDLEDADGNLNVTSITQEGKEWIDEYGNGNNNGNGDEDNNEDDEDKKPSIEEEGPSNEDGEENNDNNNDENNEEEVDDGENNDEENGEEENGEEKPEIAGEDNGEDQEQTDRELEQHAKNTSTDELEEFVKNDNNNGSQKQIAEKELENRQNGGNGDEDGNNDDGNDDENKQEFEKWVDEYLSDHDISDLQKLTIGLISDSPKELKILKNHYRESYPTDNSGNKHIGEIDADDLKEYIQNFITHMPEPHLKNYAVGLLNKNPDAFDTMKGKFDKLKKHDMV